MEKEILKEKSKEEQKEKIKEKKRYFETIPLSY